MTDAGSQVPLAVEMMTSRQLARRAQLIETVIALVVESGSASIHMRDVTDRSGVALGTVYRYFGSRDHLLAAALTEWQGKISRRVLSSPRAKIEDALPALKDFLRRALHAFERSPGMAVLNIQMVASSDPDVLRVMEQSSQLHAAAFDHLLAGVPSDEIFLVRLAIECVLWDAIKRMAGGRTTLREALAQVEGVADILLSTRIGRSTAAHADPSERTSA